MKWIGVAATAAFWLFALNASATTIVRDFDVTLSDLSDAPATDSPTYSSVNLQFGVTLDPTVTVGATTQGLTVFSQTVPGPVEYFYDAATGYLTIGTDVFDAGVEDLPNSFGLAIQGALSPTPTPDFGVYTDGSQHVFIAGDLSLSETAGVPEPSVWAMMLVGIALIGAALRRRTSNDFGALI